MRGRLRHRTESAAARAQIAQDHERRRAAVETLMDIGAARGFAHRVEMQPRSSALRRCTRFEMRARTCAAHSGRRGQTGARAGPGSFASAFCLIALSPGKSGARQIRFGLVQGAVASGPTSTRKVPASPESRTAIAGNRFCAARPPSCRRRASRRGELKIGLPRPPARAPDTGRRRSVLASGFGSAPPATRAWLGLRLAGACCGCGSLGAGAGAARRVAGAGVVRAAGAGIHHDGFGIRLVACAATSALPAARSFSPRCNPW